MFNNGNNGVIPVLPFGNMGGMNGFGEGWWALIVLAAMWGGFGGNGFGFGFGRGNEGGGVAAVDASLQRGFDTQTIINKLDGINNGICSLGYDQLNQMNGINTNVLTQSNALMAQLQQCCCAIENAIMQSQFAMQQGFCTAEANRASDTCKITTAIKDAVTAITQNDNNNYRSLYDQQVAAQFDALKTQNAELRARLDRCDSENMINAQTQYLTNYLRPQANPAFIVPSPWYSGSYYDGNNCCSYNNNNGCCNGNRGFGF